MGGNENADGDGDGYAAALALADGDGSVVVDAVDNIDVVGLVSR